MPDDKPPDDAELLEPDADPPPPPKQAKRTSRRDDDYAYDDFEQRDDRDDEYHPRGRKAKYDEDGCEITSEHTLWAMMAHIGVFVVSFLAPLIILIVFRQKSQFVVRHARECLNHMITLVLLNVLILGVSAAIGYGVYVVTQEWIVGLIVFDLVAVVPSLIMGIANLVFLVKAAIAAGKGEEYRYPMTWRLIG